MKIIYKIKQKPKLARAIKIIGISITIFFAAVGVVFSGLLIGSCANYKTAEALEDHNQSKAPSYLVAGNEEALICNTDFCSSVFLSNILYVTGAQYTSLDEYVVYKPVAATLLDYSDITFNNGQIDFPNNLPYIDLIQIYNRGTYTSTKTYTWYRFNFYNRGSMAVVYYFEIWVTQTDQSRFSGTLVTLDGTINEKYIYINTYVDREFYSFFSSNSTINGTYYQSGYNDGYTAGYNDGYNTGSTGMTSNPFNLIRNAFESVASLLNIQVLPNLTLGVLVFTPLIVTILIVVFKLFKG